VLGSVTVRDGGTEIARLNELECVDGSVYANVWTTDTIVRIDPGTGQVTARIDAGGLLTAAEREGADVLNGIAYDPASGDFLVTGKLWPKLFRVRFVPR
jgi:glutamine cyclotransferase